MGILNILLDKTAPIPHQTKPKFNSQTEKVRQEHENLLHKLAENIRIFERLRREINLYVKNGEIDKDILIGMLLKVCALMCGDMVFYEMNLERLGINKH